MKRLRTYKFYNIPYICPPLFFPHCINCLLHLDSSDVIIFKCFSSSSLTFLVDSISVLLWAILLISSICTSFVRGPFEGLLQSFMSLKIGWHLILIFLVALVVTHCSVVFSSCK